MTQPTDPDARASDPWVVAVANQKGGVGKSLLSLGLAAVTADASGKAFLVDIDPQSTTAEVADRAERAGLALPFDYTADTDPTHLGKLRKVRGVDMILVDCPGSLEGRDVLAAVLDQADFVVIPYVHDPFYVTPTRRTAAMCAERGVPYRVLINRVDPRRGSGPLEDAQAVLDKLELPRFRSFVREYAAHSHAHVEGVMITQYRGDRNAGNARDDIRRVHTELLMQLGQRGA
ncbi:AAA family ATPase [Microtetraspora malaysiensis]|uniref:nucleotide-binding protein n=1 Tax=Microtetraspora malaysiensis TaxID=161358 RepID=UPI003D93500C